ncbi:MAG TPA: homoserine dehydrogenase, partial [Demequinaceae bacterium]
MADDERRVRIAILGAGTVGSQVARVLIEQKDDLAQRIGAIPEIIGIAVLDPDEVRTDDLPRSLLTSDIGALVAEADIIVELMGGIEPARTVLLRALNGGKSVVTANKALL